MRYQFDVRSFGWLAILFALLVNPLMSHAAYPAQEKQFSEWIATIAPGLKSRTDEPDVWQPFDWRHESSFLVVLDESGEPANVFNIPGGVALADAAVYYALGSGDFNVTLGDLENSGWWPYRTFPSDLNRDLVIPQNHGRRYFDKYTMLKHLGGPEWVLRAKAEILGEFYSDFFFRRTEEEKRLSGFVTKEQLNAELLAAQTPRRAVGDLPARDENFWINPYTGVPMRISDEPGDITLQDISWSYQNAPRVFSDGKVNDHSYSSSYRDENSPQPAKLEVPMLRWHFVERLPWHKVVGMQSSTVPEWLLHGPTSSAALAHKDGLLGIYAPLEHGRTNKLLIDETGERAPLEMLACPQALQLAAAYYALATLDNQVSLREIIEAGLWPYDTFPDWLDLSETLYGFEREEQLKLYYTATEQAQQNQWQRAGWGWYLAENMGSPEWLLWRRAEILNLVHTELFFTPHPDVAPGAAFDPRSGSVLPKFAAFWTNPVATAAAGKPVPFEFGYMLGQLTTVDVNLLRPMYYGAPIRYEQEVPLINLANKTQLMAGAEPEFRYRERTVLGVMDGNRAWLLPENMGGGLGELRWRFTEPFTANESVLMDFGWDAEKDTYPVIGIDGKPQAIELQPRRPYTRSYKLGQSMENMLYSNTFATSGTTRIIYDSVAPRVKQYGAPQTEWARGYSMTLNMVRGRFGVAQLPAGRAGIDELAPPVAEPAVASR